jgi:hypothetical protein
MAAKIDLLMKLREGRSCEAVALHFQCSLAWVEIVAGKRIPDCAFSRRAGISLRPGKPITLARAA